MSKESRSSNREGIGSTSKIYDLEVRSAKFGEAVIAFAKRVPTNLVTDPLVSQLVRAATSVGANYCEANDSGTRKEFSYRISVCKRESREAMHWLRMMAAAASEMRDDSRKLWSEAKELHLIFAAIHLKTKSANSAQPRNSPRRKQ